MTWKAEYCESGNNIQGGLPGYTIQDRVDGKSSEGIAYNISRKEHAELIARAPKMAEKIETLTAQREALLLAARAGSDMLRESAKQHRGQGDTGHGRMADNIADTIDSAITGAFQ
jgi:hypothetical protein